MSDSRTRVAIASLAIAVLLAGCEDRWTRWCTCSCDVMCGPDMNWSTTVYSACTSEEAMAQCEASLVMYSEILEDHGYSATKARCEHCECTVEWYEGWTIPVPPPSTSMPFPRWPCTQ